MSRLPELNAGSTPRVIRRFRVGEGWAFVVRVDALNEDQSHRVAELLSVGEEAGVIYRRVGSRTIRVLETQQIEAEVVTSPVATTVPPPDESRLVAAMGREQEDIDTTEDPDPVAVKSKLGRMKTRMNEPMPLDEGRHRSTMKFEPRLQSASSIMQRAVRAHGGEGGGLPRFRGRGVFIFAINEP